MQIMEEHYLNSSFREKLIEHLFVGELLKLAWQSKNYSLEVSKPEVDNSGYDLILEAKGVLRHVQLKSTFIGGKTSRQNVHISLSKKQSGCVVWVYFDESTLNLGPFLLFGGNPGEPLPDISAMKTARHTKGDAGGYKAERPNIRTVNKGSFKSYDSVESLFQALFNRL